MIHCHPRKVETKQIVMSFLLVSVILFPAEKFMGLLWLIMELVIWVFHFSLHSTSFLLWHSVFLNFISLKKQQYIFIIDLGGHWKSYKCVHVRTYTYWIKFFHSTCTRGYIPIVPMILNICFIHLFIHSFNVYWIPTMCQEFF